MRRNTANKQRRRHAIIHLVSVFLVVTIYFVENAKLFAADNQVEIFNRLYSDLLQTYWRPAVHIHGIETTVFDYALMSKDSSKPNALLTRISQALESTNLRSLSDRNSKQAFWINVYNFAAIRLIIEHYPVDSIRSLKISLIKHPWSQKTVRIGDKEYSLTEIEKDILLEQFGDPRIIFAVSCAAVSCPDRTPYAFSGERLDEQLDEMIRTFFSNSGKGLLLDRERHRLTLSWILEKDADLFPSAKGGVLGFISPYLDNTTRQWLNSTSVEVKYFTHDWTLNDLAQAD